MNGADFDAIDRRIEVQQDRFESCRKAMAISRAILATALVTLAAASTVAVSLRTPAVVFTAIAAAIGAVVWLGASRSSRDEAAEELATLHHAKDKLIDEVAARNGWRDLTPTVH